MAIVEYTFRLQEADWDFGTGVGTQKVICYHQYIDANGLVVTPAGTGAGGAWVPFIPGPVVKAKVGDTVKLTIQNRISDPSGNFIEALKTETLVHNHGIEMSNTYDGTPVTQKPFHTGLDFTYKLKIVRPGMFWYHPHWDSLTQMVLGAYGPIICEDDNTDELRTDQVIPHIDRTFNISLSEISFQSDRGVATNANFVAQSAISTTTPPIYIRNIMDAAGAQNFGDVFLINGKYDIPFNDPNGNFQQFWAAGDRLTAGPITVHETESLAFYILNASLHRSYKVQLVYKTNGTWNESDNLFRLGGEGGLMDEARGGGGVFGNYRIRGYKDRTVAGGGTGLNTIQTSSELKPGEFLIPGSSRALFAFAVEPTWREVALRVNGFSVWTGAPVDEDPVDMIIAHFNVGATPNPAYVLPTNIAAGTQLLTALTTPAPLPDLSGLPAVTSFTGCDPLPATLTANDVIVPATPILTDYAIELSGPGGAAINNFQAIWTDEGVEQPTFGNTRYVKKGDVVEWRVETVNPNTDHYWHMHGASFQPIRMELNDGAGGYTTLYDWDFVEYVDSIYVPSRHRLTYRFRVEDRPYIGEDDVEYPDGVIGRWLGHCHIFKHAHRGMMMNFFVLDGCHMNGFQFTDVYLRDNVTDDGTEPSVGMISASPDIILRKTTVADGMASFGQGSGTENDASLGFEAEKGQTNYIYVRVNNRGSRLGKVKTDVYWSEVSTLVTPNFWNHIGETNEVTVQPGILTVADPLPWADADIPATGHYCFIGITGSENDTKSLSPFEVANFTTAYTWAQFTDLIRKHNNVTWRNFNVVDLVASLGIGGLDFKFRGAFDRARFFDLVIENPFDRLEVVIPNDNQFQEQLEERVRRFSVKDNDLIIEMWPKSKLRLRNIKLEKDGEYNSRFIVRDANEEVIGKTLYVAQEYISEYEEEIAEVELAIKRKNQDLKQVQKHGPENLEEVLLREIEELKAKKKAYEALAANRDEAERIEVGRVSWYFVKDREEKEDKHQALIDWLIARIRKFLERIFSRWFGSGK